MNSQREAFEKWYAEEFGRRPTDVEYETDICWRAWQAATEQGEPVGWEFLPGDLRTHLGDFKNAITILAGTEEHDQDGYWGYQLKVIHRIEDLITTQQTRTPAEKGVGEAAVPMPTTIAQAKGMALVGTSWLQANAPDELKPTGEGVPDEFSELTDLAPRALELADRFVAPGPKAAHVSAPETHEIAEFVGLAAALLATQQPPED